MIINQKFFVSGFQSLLHGAPNMDTLVALGAGASYGYSTYALFAMTDAQMRQDMAGVMTYMHEFYFESAAMILTLITVCSCPFRITTAVFGARRIRPFKASVVFPLERASSILPTVINVRIIAADSKRRCVCGSSG